MKYTFATLVLALTTAALAVTPQTWDHNTEAVFRDTVRKAAIVDSHGDVKLSPAISFLLPGKDAPAVISAVVSLNGKLYASSGTTGWVYTFDAKGAVAFAALPSTIITTMIADGDSLLVGTGGKEAGLYRVTAKAKVTKLFSHKDVSYVWAIAKVRGVLYVATGTNGKIFRLAGKKGAKGVEVYSAGKLAKNILSLAAGTKGTLYAGTDTSGLVIAIAGKKARVLYDAAETEITAIVVGPNGNIFAATGDLTHAVGDVKPKGTKDGKAAAPGETQADPAGDKPKAVEKPAAKGKKKSAKKPAKSSAKSSAKSGKKPEKKNGLPLDPTKPAVKPSGPSSSSKPSSPGAPGPAVAGKGNAIYRIQPNGIVQTLFRQPVTIQTMLPRGDELIVATGNEGKVFAVRIDGQLYRELIDTEAKQVTALCADAKGLVIATSNPGSVGRVAARFSAKGTLVCKPLDATQSAHWGTIKIDAQIPTGTGVTVETRSGNLAEATDDTWSNWSKAARVTSGYMAIGSPAARFLQYRLTLTSKGKTTPTVGAVKVIYQVGNLPPQVSGVQVTASAEKTPSKVFRQVEIKAGDPNKDALQFDVEYLRQGSANWIRLAENLKAPKYNWDTRTVPDGVYTLRVTASDAAANIPAAALRAARLSENLIVDNTPPTCGKMSAKAGATTVAIAATFRDKFSRIVEMAYTVDSGKTYTPVLPADGICDNTTESVRFTTVALRKGPRCITLRVKDELGNTLYVPLDVTVGK